MDNYSKIDHYSGFANYAMKHLGVSSMQLYYWDKIQDNIYNSPKVMGSLTPMILEERELRATQMSIFDRLMMDRILWVAGVVNENMSTVVQAQLMYLDTINESDIKMYVDSPGGSCSAGLGMVDVMDYIASDIQTINTGLAASMGSVILGAGTKGKRHSLPNSKVMLHTVSSGTSGVLADMKISIDEAEKTNNILFNLLGKYCDKSSDTVKNDASRDFWLTAKKAVEYGIIDSIIDKKIK